MQINTKQKELLEAAGMLWNEDLITFKQWCELRHTITTSNSLALGKPEPLAKNKQALKEFKSCVAFVRCEQQCSMCRNTDNGQPPFGTLADATSR